MARRPAQEINLDNLQSENLRHVRCYELLEKIGAGSYGDNILLDDEGNLKIADSGLARKLPDGPNEPLTREVITHWYRPPELLLGSCNYGPAVDIWSSGCIFVELLWRKLFLKGDNDADQLNKIYSMFGVATEYNWPGVSELPKYQKLMPKAEIKGAFKDTFRNDDPHAVMLLEKMLTLDPSQRISAKDALEHDFFRVEPLPSKLTSLKVNRPFNWRLLEGAKRSRERAFDASCNVVMRRQRIH